MKVILSLIMSISCFAYADVAKTGKRAAAETPSEIAREMLSDAVKAVQKNDQKTIDQFDSKEDTDFHKWNREIYVFCFDLESGKLSYGQNKGKPVESLTNDKSPGWGKDLLNNARDKTSDFHVLHYWAPKPPQDPHHPPSNPGPLYYKNTYLQTFGHQACGVGYYD